MIDKFMDKPWFLRFTALALAIILFFSIQADGAKSDRNTVGDTWDAIRDVPVEVFYDNENLIISGVPETVDVTIEGPANIVQSTKYLRDFILKVDLRTLRNGKHTVRIETENLSDKLNVRLDPATVEVVIEEKITKTFKVDPELNERLLAENYNVVKMDVNPSEIEVTGAKSIVDAIEFVKVSATGDKGINKSFEQRAKVRVLDRELNKLNVSIEPAEVNVKVEIEENSKEVPIELRKRGLPADNVTIDSITTELKTVKLYGSKKTLDAITQLRVDVDVSKVTESGKLELKLPKPKGVSKLSEDKITVNVVATVLTGEDPPPDISMEPPIEEEVANVDVTKEFKDVPVAVKGLDEKFTSSFLHPSAGVVDVTVTAEQGLINSLKKSDLTVTLDASDTDTEGEHSYPLSVNVPNGVAWKLSTDEVTLEIKLA